MINNRAIDQPHLCVGRVGGVLKDDRVASNQQSEEQVNVVPVLIDMVHLKLGRARLRRVVVTEQPRARVTAGRACRDLVVIET